MCGVANGKTIGEHKRGMTISCVAKKNSAGGLPGVGGHALVTANSRIIFPPYFPLFPTTVNLHGGWSLHIGGMVLSREWS